MTTLPLVLCDRREPSERPAELDALGLRTWHDRSAAEPELEFGDYSWQSLAHDFTVGVEVKTIWEALTRFQNKELQRQLRGLHDTYDIPIFLFGGKLERTPDGYCKAYGFTRLLGYDGFFNWLYQSTRYDLPELRIEHISNDNNLMVRLASLVAYYEKPEHKATWAVAERRPLFSTDDEEEKALAALMPYPGWGEELARRVLDSGMTPGEAITDIYSNAGDRIRNVKGVGPERVTKMKAVLDWKKVVPPDTN